MTSTRRAAPGHRAWLAQTRVELTLTIRNGEAVLLTFLIPTLMLIFFSLVDVLPTGSDEPVQFLFPGVVALAVMSTSMVATAIATGFERQLGVLKRLGSTPLSRGQLLAAKTTSIAAVEAAQILVLTLIAVALGFDFSNSQALPALAAALLASIAFAGIGLILAGSLRALTTLAAANGLYLVLLLLSGMVIPLDKLPEPVSKLSRLLPAGALAEAIHGALGSESIPGQAWVVLSVWALVAPLAAARLFRWE